jgi:hypothetical protein
MKCLLKDEMRAGAKPVALNKVRPVFDTVVVVRVAGNAIHIAVGLFGIGTFIMDSTTKLFPAFATN